MGAHFIVDYRANQYGGMGERPVSNSRRCAEVPLGCPRGDELIAVESNYRWRHLSYASGE